MAVTKVEVDFSTNTSIQKITSLFPEYVGANKLTIPGFHFTAACPVEDGATVQGTTLELLYALTSDTTLTDTANQTIMFATAATRVNAGGVSRHYVDRRGLYVPAGKDVWLRTAGNVSGGFKVYGDIEYQVDP